jgi:hypothetical protein
VYTQVSRGHHGPRTAFVGQGGPCKPVPMVRMAPIFRSLRVTLARLGNHHPSPGSLQGLTGRLWSNYHVAQTRDQDILTVQSGRRPGIPHHLWTQTRIMGQTPARPPPQRGPNVSVIRALQRIPMGLALFPKDVPLPRSHKVTGCGGPLLASLRKHPGGILLAPQLPTRRPHPSVETPGFPHAKGHTR